MKRALLAAALLALAGCHSQDAALLVTFTGQYLIPDHANLLKVDVVDSGNVVVTRNYPLTSGFPKTLTLVQSGGFHKHVSINATLTLTGQAGAVGLGKAEADFQDGQTVNATVNIFPPQ